jgi:hypothetical protein
MRPRSTVTMTLTQRPVVCVCEHVLCISCNADTNTDRHRHRHTNRDTQTRPRQRQRQRQRYTHTPMRAQDHPSLVSSRPNFSFTLSVEKVNPIVVAKPKIIPAKTASPRRPFQCRPIYIYIYTHTHTHLHTHTHTHEDPSSADRARRRGLRGLALQFEMKRGLRDSTVPLSEWTWM